MAKKAAPKKVVKKEAAPKKKKSDYQPPTAEEAIENIYNKIGADYGDGTLIGGEEFIARPKTIIPFSPALDMICGGGGIQSGTTITITGNEKTGKTCSAFSFAANCQKPEYGSRPIFYFKVEGRLSDKHLSEIQGLNLNKPHFNLITSKKGKILSAQDYLKIALDVIKTVPGAVLIIDSISALCEEKELVNGVGTETRGGGARATSQFFNIASNFIPVNDCIVICITHLMCNTSGMGAGKVEKATRRLQYQNDYKFKTVLGKDWKWKGTGGKQIGMRITWTCTHTTTGRPHQTINSFFRYGVGVDRLYEIMDFGMAAGLISGSGWYELPFVKKRLPNIEIPKLNGGEGVYKKLLENPDWVQWLNEDVMEMIGSDSNFVSASGDEE